MRRTEPWYRLAELAIRPPLAMWLNWRFEGLEHIPSEGPVLVACNHISYFDPLAHGYMLLKARRRPRYLAKKELYSNPLLRSVLRGTRQIPVDRGSTDAAQALSAAVAALQRGECIFIYPEGSATRDPALWPMKARTGGMRRNRSSRRVTSSSGDTPPRRSRCRETAALRDSAADAASR